MNVVRGTGGGVGEEKKWMKNATKMAIYSDKSYATLSLLITARISYDSAFAESPVVRVYIWSDM